MVYNGDLTLNVNGEDIRTWNKFATTSNHSKTYYLDGSVLENRLLLTYEPYQTKDNPNKPFFAKVLVRAINVEPSMDACMKGKECMAIFGQYGNSTQLNAQYTFRNDNALQMNCMLGNTTGMSAAEQQVCTDWEQCLVDSGHK